MRPGTALPLMLLLGACSIQAEWSHRKERLLDLVDELDLSENLIPAQAKDPRGEKGYDPRMLTLLLLYAYCAGTVSSRKIERACYEDLAFRVLTGNQQPE